MSILYLFREKVAREHASRFWAVFPVPVFLPFPFESVGIRAIILEFSFLGHSPSVWVVVSNSNSLEQFAFFMPQEANRGFVILTGPSYPGTGQNTFCPVASFLSRFSWGTSPLDAPRVT